MKSVYLDMCCFNRPYDDQTQPRIRLETDDRLLKRCQKAVPALNAHRPADALAILENWYKN